MNVFVLAILGYFLYRFVAGFLIPLFRTSVRMRQRFHEMNQNADDSRNKHASSSAGNTEKPESPKAGSKMGEYIDFEEVK